MTQFAKQHFDVLINSTPCGMAGSKQAAARCGKRAERRNWSSTWCTTRSKRRCSSWPRPRGIPVISGVEMFVQQGARQFEIWTGKPAPEAEMLRVVEAALRKRS